MAEARTDEEKAQAFAAMTGSISVIDNVLDDDNDFCNYMTKEDICRAPAGALQISKRIDGRIVIGSASYIPDNSFQSFVVRRH